MSAGEYGGAWSGLQGAACVATRSRVEIACNMTRKEYEQRKLRLAE